MTFDWTETKRIQKFDELHRRCKNWIFRILFNEFLGVDQTQAPVLVFEFSDDRRRIIECLVACGNTPEVFERGCVARAFVNRMSKTTVGRDFENDSVLEPDETLRGYGVRRSKLPKIFPRYAFLVADGLLFGIPGGCAGLCRLN